MEFPGYDWRDRPRERSPPLAASTTATRSDRATRSVDPRAGSLDDRQPLREFRFDESGGFLGAAAGRGIDADLLEPLGQRRVVHRLLDRRVESVDDRLWRSCRREDRVPGVTLV